MSTSEHANASSTGTTSKKEPPAVETEAQFLDRQAAEAKQAIANVWSEMKHTLSSSVSVRRWTEQYPWMSTATALAAGVAAGYFLTPRDRDEAAEMWEKFKRHFEKEKESAEAASSNGGAPPESHQPSLGKTLVTELVKNVLPLITAVASNFITADQKDNKPDTQSETGPATNS
jgi:hypothetical protein